MVRRLRELIERLLPWWDPEQAVKSAERTERVLDKAERLAGISTEDVPRRLRGYDDYRLHR